MQQTVEKTKEDIENLLKNDEEHQDKNIDFILINPDTNETITIASDGFDSMIYFAPYTKDEENIFTTVDDWDFSFDFYFFDNLQNGYQIGYITNETHYNLWNEIKEYYPGDIYNKEGVQLYLQYCADHGITKEFIDKMTNHDTPNIMNFFEGLSSNETKNASNKVLNGDSEANNFKKKSMERDER